MSFWAGVSGTAEITPSWASGVGDVRSWKPTTFSPILLMEGCLVNQSPSTVSQTELYYVGERLPASRWCNHLTMMYYRDCSSYGRWVARSRYLGFILRVRLAQSACHRIYGEVKFAGVAQQFLQQWHEISGAKRLSENRLAIFWYDVSVIVQYEPSGDLGPVQWCRVSRLLVASVSGKCMSLTTTYKW